MKKFMPSVLTLVFLSAVFVFPNVTLGKSEEKAPVSSLYQVLPDEPEGGGEYLEPTNHAIRVKVYVHHAKPTQPPITTCQDPDSTAVVDPAGWKLPTGNWTYRLNPSTVPASVGQNNLAVFSDLGFNEWETAQNQVTFSNGATTTKNKSAYDGQNIITWGKASNGTLAVTYIRYSPSTKIVLDVDTIMNNRYAWSWTKYGDGICGNPNTYDAQAILTHEQGHWLGLNDEYTSPYINNTMYGYGYKGDIKEDTLTNGDITGTQNIYH